MNEQKILEIIKQFDEKLPKFPDGRIDYSNSDTAPVITVFIEYQNNILLLKRSDKVRTYQGKWNTVAGYLDELKPIREKVLEEIREELGIERDNNILSIHIGEFYQFTDIEVNKTWIVYPVLIKLRNKPEIKLDWEHTEYKWIKPKEIKNFDIVFNLENSLEKIQNFL